MGIVKKLVTFGKQSGKVIMASLIGVVVGGLGFAAVRAAVPDVTGIYHVCYDNSSGAMKVIDSSSQSCSGSETEMTLAAPKPGGFVVNMSNADFSNADLRYRDFSMANLQSA